MLQMSSLGRRITIGQGLSGDPTQFQGQYQTQETSGRPASMLIIRAREEMKTNNPRLSPVIINGQVAETVPV